jgi:hypothetical protein
VPTKAAEDEDQARRDRARQRRTRMTVQVVALGDEAAPGPEGGVEERIELLCDLTRAAWAMTGAPWPRLARLQWPVSSRKLGEEA